MVWWCALLLCGGVRCRDVGVVVCCCGVSVVHSCIGVSLRCDVVSVCVGVVWRYVGVVAVCLHLGVGMWILVWCGADVWARWCGVHVCGVVVVV